MATVLEYTSPSVNLPVAQLVWLDQAQNPVNFSSGWTFQLTLSQPPNAAVLVKSTNITGGDGSGGTPNITIIWQPNELSVLTPGNWRFILKATRNDGSVREMIAVLKIDAAVVATS